jgi:hypothetical protein
MNAPLNLQASFIFFFLHVRKKIICKKKEDKSMSDTEMHIKAANEKRVAALEEFEKGRHIVVGDLTIKAVEQAIEAAASLEGKHFHIHPRSAHANRLRWLKENLPSLSKDVNELWGAYGALGYEGVDGERAKKALEAMERVLNGIERKTSLRFK